MTKFERLRYRLRRFNSRHHTGKIIFSSKYQMRAAYCRFKLGISFHKTTQGTIHTLWYIGSPPPTITLLAPTAQQLSARERAIMAFNNPGLVYEYRRTPNSDLFLVWPIFRRQTKANVSEGMSDVTLKGPIPYHGSFSPESRLPGKHSHWQSRTACWNDTTNKKDNK